MVRDVGTGKVRQEIISGLTTVDLQVAFGLYDRLELGLNAPLIVTSGQGVREIDEDGCPEPDNDTDTILDAADLCPLNAEDLDSFDDQDGCPEFDNDKDGVLDADDKCPLEPEVVNGIDDQDGCPDKGVSSVRITSERIEILQKVFFDNDKDSIKPVSFNLLGQVSAALKAHPEMAKVRVEGHTDRWGDPARNLDLSKRRAAAVVRYLVEVGGLSPSRLESGGYGYTRPLDPRLNFKADDKNRRVEFVVVGGTTPTAPAGFSCTPTYGTATVRVDARTITEVDFSCR